MKPPYQDQGIRTPMDPSIPIDLTRRGVEVPAAAVLRGWDLAAIALGFGLITGLGEGLSLFVYSKFGWNNWDKTLFNGSVEAIWTCPWIDAAVFGVLGLAAAAICRGGRRPRLTLAAVWVLATLMFFDWVNIMAFGCMHTYAFLVLAAGLGTSLTRYCRPRLTAMAGSFRRRTVLAGLALVALTLTGQTALWLRERLDTAMLPAADPGRPNVLCVVIDTLRADRLSCYGYDRPTSPNLDRMAGESTLFENCISTSSWTQPSHASLLTGRHTHEHRAEWLPLDRRYPTLGEAMSRLGYRTAAFSANPHHFAPHWGLDRGFQRFEGEFATLTNRLWGTFFGSRWAVYVHHRLLENFECVTRRPAPAINGAFLRWADADRTRPFFAFVNYFDVHDPREPPEPFRSRFALTTDAVANSASTLNERRDLAIRSKGAYDGCIAYTDSWLGQLDRALKERGLAENTVVIVTSDHGEFFGEHGLYEHGNALYRELIHVPLLVRWPRHVPAGRRVPAVVSSKAMAATLMDLLEAKEEFATFPGPSLAGLWRTAAAADAWPPAVSELAGVWFYPKRSPCHDNSIKCLTTSQWHYIAYESGKTELYDLHKDPQESDNLANRPDAEPECRRLKAELDAAAPGWVEHYPHNVKSIYKRK